MVFKSLHTGVLIRVILLVVTCMIFAYAFYTYHDLLINLNIGTLIILETWLLIRFVNRTNRDLEHFFLSIKNEDTSLSYPPKSPGRSFDALYKQLEILNEHFRQIKSNLASQELFNKVIISHINTGILVMEAHGKVKLYNLAISHLLNMPVIGSIYQLDKIQKEFSKSLLEIQPGQRITIKVRIDGDMKELLIRTSEYRENGKTCKLISMQDIKPELDEKEMVSWQKLIRILTHEITNSIGPINSTIDTIADFFITGKEGRIRKIIELDQKVIDNAVKGINIIRERSSGLLDFVQKFRDMTLIPVPQTAPVSVGKLFEHVKIIMQEYLEFRGISMSCRVQQKDLVLRVDKSMIEQVLINLVRNAAEAGCTAIRLEAMSDGNNQMIKVIDNGHGIKSDILENIFVPFFTTRENGSGIGLSLAREIMRLHQGMIHADSASGKGTTITLSFLLSAESG
jgi:two-component system, NtrC family, nitrogen regulation sensor histidine kinase NtrY